ncbi:MAG: DEAD/DEAH box helicase [Nitrospiraceae bacterium]|nr:DEAD/DEAH box helicase [Nitrospiraceae bacterium]
MLKYKGLTLDKFQEDSIKYIEQNKSVVVSAPTGTGKTLIADYLISKHMKDGKRIFYTAPIKALSNQKYRDFVASFGKSNVGILTGDVVINHDAPLVIMTTEVYRNMVVKKDTSLDDLAYVIFDEIHFINDIERGTVWEESIIFSPENVRFLCLSATIPNAREFADWIESIKNHKVEVVIWNKRAVPLQNLIFDSDYGLIKPEELEKRIKNDSYFNISSSKHRSRRRGKLSKDYRPPTHIELISHIKDRNFLPMIYFSFSRDSCVKKATKLSKIYDFTTNQEKSKIIRIFNSKIDKSLLTLDSVKLVKSVITKGIGIHHAGLLPILKEIVEVVFSEGLIKVLYATETFAVGINMPAKTVCFDDLRKYDGISFRYLNSKEYFQLAGRAGRRGIDKKGWDIIMFNRRSINVSKLKSIISKDMEPLVSQYKLSYNTVLNLLSRFDIDEIKLVLKKSFYYFQKKEHNSRSRALATFGNILKKLKTMGYVTDDNKLTFKGKGIYSYELIISEIFSSDIWKQLEPYQINITIAAIIYEPRLKSYFKYPKSKKEYQELLSILSKNDYVYKNINKKNLLRMFLIIKRWSEGCEFAELLNYTNLQEGDIIRLIRQVIDYEQQIKKSCWDSDLIEKMNACIHLIKRDLLLFDFEKESE